MPTPTQSATPTVDNSDLMDAVVGHAPVTSPSDNSDLAAAVVGRGGATPPPQSQPGQPSVLPPADDPMFLKRDWERVKGFAKGAARTAAGAVDVLNTDYYEGGPTPYTGKAVPFSQGVSHLTDTIRKRTEMTNPQQEIGDFVESAMEFLPLMEEKAPGAAVNLAEKFGMGGELAKFAQKYPKLAAAWNVMMAGTSGAARGAGEQGVQTYLKTGGDEAATREAATTGALTGGGLSTLASAAGEVGNAIGRGRAGTRTVAQAPFETVPKTGKALLRNTADVVQDPATQSVDLALGNVARTGVQNSLLRANAARAPEAEIIPPERQLPGRAGFTLGAAEEPTETQTSDLLQPARKKQIGTRVVEGKGPGTFDEEQYRTGVAPPPTGEGELTQRGSHREPINQYLTDVKPGSQPPRADEVAGPGVMILTDDGQAMSPERARQQVAQYERILGDEDELGEMGVRQHADLVRAHADLKGQLDRYDDFAASQPHFPPHNVPEIVRNTHSLGDASEQLKAAHAPFWQQANEASGGEWTNLREREKWLRGRLNSKTPVGNWDELQAELRDNQQRQMDFFDQHKTTVSPQEWETARSGYQDGIVLGNLDDLFQRKFGGISRELEQRGIATGNKRQRIFEPGSNFNQQLEDFYNGGFRGSATNKDVLQRTIGQDHMDALHDLGLMFNDAERMPKIQSLVMNMVAQIKHHYHGVKGVLAGGGGAAMLGAGQGLKAAGVTAGVPFITGTAAGINRYIGERLVTDPEFLKTFEYALKNAIPPRTAGPLLAARIIATAQNQEKRQQPKKKTGAQ